MSNGLETRFPNLYLAILTQISRQTWELWLLPQAKLRGVPPDAIEAAGVHPTSLVTLAEMLKETMVFTSQISMKAGTSPPPLFRTVLHKNWKMQLFQKGADSPDSIHKQNSEQMYTLKKYLDSSFQEFHRNPEFHLKSALKIAIKNQNWTHQFLLFFGPFWLDEHPQSTYILMLLASSEIDTAARGTCNRKNCQKRRQMIGEKLRMRRPETTLWF